MRFAADGQTFGLISEVAERYRHRRRRIFGPDETANRAQAIVGTLALLFEFDLCAGGLANRTGRAAKRVEERLIFWAAR